MASATSRRVYVDLIGDQLHVEHARLLERVGALGDEVVVGLLDDDALATVGYEPLDSAATRADLVQANRHVDLVVTGAPLVPTDAFLEEHDIDVVAVVDSYGHAKRQETFDRLAADDRGVVIAWDERAAIQARLDQLVGHGETTRFDAIEARLEQLFEHQEAALEGIGALAAATFSDPAVTRDKKPALAAWRSAIRGAEAEHLGLRIDTRHGPAGSRPWITRVASWAPPGARVTLVGDYAESTAYALADTHAVTIVRPGISPGVARTDTSHLPPGAAHAVVSCAWSDIAAAIPESDTAAITDSASAIYLLRRRNLFWHFVDRIDDALILEVELSPTHQSFLRSRDGHFYCSDAYVRSALHFVRFMEVVNLVTLVDGLPRTTGACRQRVSRFTRRKNVAHFGNVRFLDDADAERIKAPVGTSIQRTYLATKRMLSDEELAFARGERGRP